MYCKILKIILLLNGLCLALPGLAKNEKKAPNPIEDLAAPEPAPVPRLPKGGNPVPKKNSDEDLDEDLKLLRQKREERQLKESPPSSPWREGLRQKLHAEAEKKFDRNLILEISLLYGNARTKHPARDYTFNLTSHFNLFWRPSQKSLTAKMSYWTGVRIAPFSGTGFYDDVPGRYGLTYFGPIFAIGQFRSPKHEDKEGHDGDTDPLASGSGRGWLLSLGIAGLSRIGESENPGPERLENDFRTSRKIIFDGAGVSLEARYLSVMFGALGTNYLIGAQINQSRQLYYAGFALAGWN